MTATSPRRVVTGLDADQRSTIIIDGPAPLVIWETDHIPADNSGNMDRGSDSFSFPEAGSRFMFFDFPPRTSEVFMHATDTIDYAVVISGEIILVTETGETLLQAGDVVVDRGIMHGWRNDGDSPCRIILVALPARPLGQGATVSGTVASRG